MRLPSNYPGLLPHEPVDDRELEVEPDKKWALRKGPLGGEREEPWPHLDRLQAHELEGFDQRPLSKWEVVVKEVPIRAAGIPDVWLENQQTATWPQHSSHLGKRHKEVLFAG